MNQTREETLRQSTERSHQNARERVDSVGHGTGFGADQLRFQSFAFLAAAFLPRGLTSLSLEGTTPAATSALNCVSVTRRTGSDHGPTPRQVPGILSSTRMAWIYCSSLRMRTACPMFASFGSASNWCLREIHAQL